MNIARPRTARLRSIGIAAAILFGSVILYTAPAGAGGDSAGEEAANGDSACRSNKAAAVEAISFTSALADPGTTQIEADTTGTFQWYSIDAPTSLVPRMKDDRHYKKAGRNYGHYGAYSPRKLVNFKRRIGVLPVKLGAVAIATLGKSYEGERYADFSYSGRVLGKAAWRRELQMAGKGAINCDGTVRVWSMGIIGGSTPWRRQAGVCTERRVVATIDRTTVCRS